MTLFSRIICARQHLRAILSRRIDGMQGHWNDSNGAATQPLPLARQLPLRRKSADEAPPPEKTGGFDANAPSPTSPSKSASARVFPARRPSCICKTICNPN